MEQRRPSPPRIPRREALRSIVLTAGLFVTVPLLASCGTNAAPTSTSATAVPVSATQPAPATGAATPAPAAAAPTNAPILAAPTVVTKAQSDIPGPEAAKIDWKQFKGSQIRWIGGLHPISETLIKMAPEFEDLTGIKVTIDQVDWTVFSQKEQLDLSNKNAQYDTYMAMYALDWQYGASGLLADLDQFINDPKLTDKAWLDLQDVSPGLLASARWDGQAGHPLGTGKLYSIPYVVETYVLGYRADLFDKYQLTVPKTLDDVVPAAKAIAEGEKSNGMAGFAVRGSLDNAPITAVWMSLLPDYGGNDFDAKMHSLVGEDANVHFTDLLINKILKPYGPPGWPGLTWDDLRHKFANQAYGMVYDCDFFSLLYEDPANSKIAGKLKYANLGGPKGMGGSTFYFGNNINANSNNKGAAWLFNEWIISKKVMRDFTAKYQNLIPTRISTWSDPAVQKMVNGWGGGTWIEAVRANLEKNVRLQLSPQTELTAVCTAWMGANQKIYGGASVQDTLVAASKEIDGIMSKAGVLQK